MLASVNFDNLPSALLTSCYILASVTLYNHTVYEFLSNDMPVFLNYSNPEIFFKVRKFYFEQFSEDFWYTFGGLPNITVIYI